jgi:hypothetical protein
MPSTSIFILSASGTMLAAVFAKMRIPKAKIPGTRTAVQSERLEGQGLITAIRL